MTESYSIDDFSEEGSSPAPPANTMRLVFGIIGLVVVAGIIVLFVWLLGGSGYDRLTPDNPSLVHPDGIRVAITGEAPLQIRIDSIPRELFLQGNVGDEWQAALDALPPYLDLKSPIYTLDTRGEAEVMVEISIPNDSQPYATLDLYRWDAEAGQWFFVAGHVDPAADVLRTNELPPNVAVFQTRPTTPLVSTILEPGQTLGEQTTVLNMVMPAGVSATQDGGFSGALAGGWQTGAGYAVVPVVRLDDPAAALALFSNDAALDAHTQNLVDYIVGGDYNGVAIEYRSMPAETREVFSQFIADLAAELDAYDKWLVVILPQPSGDLGAWNTGAYDWRAIGAAADMVMLRLSDSPGDYAPGGEAAYLLSWAVGEISRYRLHILTSSLSVDDFGGSARAITYDEAIAPLGTVALETTLPEGAEAFEPEQALTFALTGPAVPSRDLTTGVYQYTYEGDDAQTHHVWIVTAASFRNRLDLAAGYNLAGVSIENLLADGNDAGMVEVVAEFKVNRASDFPAELVLAWQVSGPEGFSEDGTTDLGAPFTWTAAGEGDFSVSAQLVGARVADRGSVAFQVAPEPTPTPTPAPVYVAPAPTEEPEEAPPAAAPVVAAGAAGSFELGGQVNGYISNPDWMRHAGMTWVKFQVAWSPGMGPDVAAGMVESAHANGFNVLLSVTGQNKFPSSIDFNSLIPFLEGLARLGPDAIEVWNEQNLDREWPRGQISATDYVNRILAPAYNAIKGVDSSIMVISGAPSPTGYFGGCADQGCDDWLYNQQMVAAGAASYMDCVGAHFNSGATSPNVETGHPADGGDHHYTWYYPGMVRAYGVFGRPICWTELGYVSGEGYGALPGNFSWGSQTTVGQQAAWLAETVQRARSEGNVRLLIVWNVDFLNWDPNDPMAGYAIIRPGGGCPACDALAGVMP